MTPPRAVLIADDHPLFRQALRLALEGVAPDARIVEAGTLEEAQDAARAADDLALVLLDLRMPGAIGCSGVALLHAERPGVPILVVSSAADPRVVQAAHRFGAVGVLGKDRALEIMERAIGDALDGHVVPPSGADPAAPAAPEPGDDMASRIATLAPMQLRVLLGVLDGRLNKQIAFDLGITETTVKAHMTIVLRKLGVATRTQAAAAIGALGLSPGIAEEDGPHPA